MMRELIQVGRETPAADRNCGAIQFGAQMPHGES